MSSRRIFGIDPGLLRTGWGVIDMDSGGVVRYVDCGVIRPSASLPDVGLSLEPRLVFIFDEIQKLLLSFTPEHIAIEEVFVNMNPKTSEKLMMARTAALIAAAKFGKDLHSYKPNEIKKNVTGSGHASKELVHTMVQKILNATIKNDDKIRTADSIDALATAICCAFSPSCMDLSRRDALGSLG
jgi:crossover junction endodeoxyribonuclease RuvC